MTQAALPPFVLDASVAEADANLAIGLLLAEVRIAPRGEALDQAIESACQAFRARESPESIKQWPSIREARRVYKALGKDPSRYRPSAEALLRRVVSGKSLYRINNAVDLLNLVSLESGYSIGGYDADRISGGIRLQRGGIEPYEAIGRGALNVEALPVLYDDQGPFGSPTSDSVRTMVRSETRRFLWVVFGFGAGPNREGYRGTGLSPEGEGVHPVPLSVGEGPALEAVLERASSLLMEHAGGQILAKRVLDWPPQD